MAELNAGGRLGYECRVGLWLNMRRTEARRTAAVIAGVQQALSSNISPEIFKALADTEDQANAEINRYNAARQQE